MTTRQAQQTELKQLRRLQSKQHKDLASFEKKTQRSLRWLKQQMLKIERDSNAEFRFVARIKRRNEAAAARLQRQTVKNLRADAKAIAMECKAVARRIAILEGRLGS